jgi:hypothetical protein
VIVGSFRHTCQHTVECMPTCILFVSGKSFEVDDVTKKRVSKSFEGVVLSYSTERQLFKVMYDVDKTQRRSGFLRAQPSAGDGKEMGRSA